MYDFNKDKCLIKICLIKVKDDKEYINGGISGQ